MNNSVFYLARAQGLQAFSACYGDSFTFFSEMTRKTMKPVK
ncbi:MAG: hypothetical protein ACPL4E_10345 [Thermoproteota archaeon]